MPSDEQKFTFEQRTLAKLSVLQDMGCGIMVMLVAALILLCLVLWRLK